MNGAVQTVIGVGQTVIGVGQIVIGTTGYSASSVSRHNIGFGVSLGRRCSAVVE